MTHNGKTSQNQKEIADMYNDYITNLSTFLTHEDTRPLNTNLLSSYVNSKIPSNQSEFNIYRFHSRGRGTKITP